MFNSLLLSGILLVSTNTNNDIFRQNIDRLECEQEVTLQNQSVAKVICIKEIQKEDKEKYKIVYKIIYKNYGESMVELRINGKEAIVYYYDLQEDDFLGSEKGKVLYNKTNLEINLPNYSFSVKIK
jgi:sucrose-6-phosphate hydrolase SacC (GH32 family)